MRVLLYTVLTVLWAVILATPPSPEIVQHVIDKVRDIKQFKRTLHVNRQNPSKACPLALYHNKRLEVRSPDDPRYNDLLTAMRVLNEEYTLEELDDPDVMQVFQKEVEELCPAESVTCDENARYRTANGTCNNIDNPFWGSTNETQRRILNPEYDDKIGSPRNKTKHADGGALPNPREISQAMHASAPGAPVIRSKKINLHVFQFGQFLDHDITRTPEVAENIDCCATDPSATE